jgi:hypothetical protein
MSFWRIDVTPLAVSPSPGRPVVGHCAARPTDSADMDNTTDRETRAGGPGGKRPDGRAMRVRRAGRRGASRAGDHSGDLPSGVRRSSRSSGLARGSEEQLLSHCEGRLARFKHLRVLEFRTSLPRTATGKMSRHRVREAYLAAPATQKRSRPRLLRGAH